MKLRFIERNGQRILQQQVEHYITPYNDLDKRFAWQDVPFVDDRIQVGPGAAGVEKLRAASDLVAERDSLRARLNDAEARCERLEEKLEVTEKTADYWRTRHQALATAVGFCRSSSTRMAIYEDAAKIRGER